MKYEEWDADLVVFFTSIILEMFAIFRFQQISIFSLIFLLAP